MADEKQPGLVRAIGRWTLVGLVLNATVASGVFGVPSVVSDHVGRAGPWACLVAAVGIGIIMACFAEVGSRFREAGGPYLYAREAFGRFAGIQIAWLAWLTRLTAAAANANLFAIYLAEFWPAASDRSPRLLVLTGLVGYLAFVNYRGVKSGARLSNIFIVAKLLPLSLFALLGMVFFKGGLAGSSLSPPAGAWMDAILVFVFAYGGFEAALLPMGEARDPRRDVPFALYTGLAVMTVLYTLIQVGVQAGLAAPETTDRPLTAAAASLVGSGGAVLITVGALVSVYGYFAGMMLNVPRLTFALAERGDFPHFFARIHARFRTPHISIVAFALLVWALAVAGSFRWNAVLSAVARLLTYASTCGALPVLRKKRRGQDAYLLPGGKWAGIAGIVFSLLLITRMGWSELLVVAATLAVAFVNWLWARRTPVKPVNPS